MADYGEHEDCYPPTGCGRGCPYNSAGRAARRRATAERLMPEVIEVIRQDQAAEAQAQIDHPHRAPYKGD